ncbi:MAG: DUF2849 domain-containing protein [Gammaproteobacteria bacterium]|nr:DUF2849 domain-containing protein [Gammaproteobacteria bacterium]
MPDAAQMVIANRLRDGFTVFLAPGDRWVESIAEGSIARGEEDARALLARGERAAKHNIVVDPYLIRVSESGGQRRPAEWREAIRAFGPTVETGRNA